MILWIEERCLIDNFIDINILDMEFIAKIFQKQNKLYCNLI